MIGELRLEPIKELVSSKNGGSVKGEISLEELGAHYFEILKRVCQGESLTIVANGRPLAEILPSAKKDWNKKAVEVLDELSFPRFANASDDAIREWLGESARE
jgi:prevent-host-death family protein